MPAVSAYQSVVSSSHARSPGVGGTSEPSCRRTGSGGGGSACCGSVDAGVAGGELGLGVVATGADRDWGRRRVRPRPGGSGRAHRSGTSRPARVDHDRSSTSNRASCSGYQWCRNVSSAWHCSRSKPASVTRRRPASQARSVSFGSQRPPSGPGPGPGPSGAIWSSSSSTGSTCRGLSRSTTTGPATGPAAGAGDGDGAVLVSGWGGGGWWLVVGGWWTVLSRLSRLSSSPS